MQEHPLILVFYIDKGLYQQPEIIKQFVQAVNDMIHDKKANMMAFFLPTEGPERVECINPALVAEADMVRINKMVDDIAKSFDIGQGADKNLNEDEN